MVAAKRESQVGQRAKKSKPQEKRAGERFAWKSDRVGAMVENGLDVAVTFFCVSKKNQRNVEPEASNS